MAATVIENLITTFGFEIDQKKLDSFDKKIKSTVTGLAGFIAIGAAAATGVFLFAKNIAASTDKLGKFSEQIGVDIESLQELGFAAELNGSSIDSMNSSLSSLSKIMSEASRGLGGGVEAFGILGLSVTDTQGKIKDTDEFLFEIADSMSKLGSQAEKIELASKLGIDASLISTLDKGSAALRRQREEAQSLGFILDKNAASGAANFNDALLKTQSVISGVTNAIGTGLMKEITPMLNAFVEWFKANKDIIKVKVKEFIDGLVSVIRNLVSVVLWGIKIFKEFKGVFIAIGAALVILNAVLLTTKLIMIGINLAAIAIPLLIGLAIAAIVAGIILLIDDIIAFATGADSALGDLLKGFPKIEAAVKAVIEGFKIFFTWLGTASVKAFNTVTSFLTKLWDDPVQLFKDIWNDTTDFFKNIWDTAIEFVKTKFKDFVNFIPKFLKVGFDKIKDLIPGISNFFTGESESSDKSLINKPQSQNLNIPTTGPSSNTSNNETTDNRTINITVNGGDPAEVRKIFDESMERMNTDAISNLSTNVEN